MEQPSAPSRGGRKRRGGKRKRSTIRHNEDEERKTEEPPPKQEEERQEEKQEEKQEDKTPQKWSCPACTFLNEASRCFCEMCETPNPSPSVSCGLGAAASDWSCAACTMVNPAATRVCGVCGTLNPRPALPSGLSIRLSEALGGGGDESFSSSSEDSEDSDSDDEEEDTWTCTRCDTLSGGCMCPNCFAQRPKAARKAADEDKSKEKKQAKKRKRRKHEKLQERAKLAYGISICELKKLVLEPTGSRLVDTLQTLTHTLAMMDASADNEWADGPSFLVRGFGGGRSSETAKDPELLTVLADIFRGQERTYPVEVRLLQCSPLTI
ncbi:Zinc finger, RanBP2-type [Phytophthora cactorum]|nr:Zinc finger, RanBP2-type [Phytophthora cactorum]